jgi:hypothetical protein
MNLSEQFIDIPQNKSEVVQVIGEAQKYKYRNRNGFEWSMYEIPVMHNHTIRILRLNVQSTDALLKLVESGNNLFGYYKITRVHSDMFAKHKIEPTSSVPVSAC